MESQNQQGDGSKGLAWAAGLMFGLVAVIMAFAAADHAVGRLRRVRRDLNKGIPPGQWSQAILGSSMHAVAAAWGPPPLTTAPKCLGADSATLPYLTADTWYYPINPSRRLAMAIHFARGIARHVQIIRSPQ